MKIWTALLVVALAVLAFYVDRTYYDQQAVTFLGKTLIRVTTWMAFWR
ncbi:glyceraldehyde-3-phosphate dehydrogenase [Oceanibium sediminis]|nr:glyceraldehyde-3-phosphate dehydrogenase [Oceanibium sediminis]